MLTWLMGYWFLKRWGEEKNCILGFWKEKLFIYLFLYWVNGGTVVKWMEGYFSWQKWNLEIFCTKILKCKDVLYKLAFYKVKMIQALGCPFIKININDPSPWWLQSRSPPSILYTRRLRRNPNRTNKTPFLKSKKSKLSIPFFSSNPGSSDFSL